MGAVSLSGNGMLMASAKASNTFCSVTETPMLGIFAIFRFREINDNDVKLSSKQV